MCGCYESQECAALIDVRLPCGKVQRLPVWLKGCALRGLPVLHHRESHLCAQETIPVKNAGEHQDLLCEAIECKGHSASKVAKPTPKPPLPIATCTW